MLSQDDVEVGLYFVIPSKCASKEDCDPIMTDTYNDAIGQSLDPQWLTERKCTTLQPDKRNIFVFQEFCGDAFEHLKQFKCVLVGPQCLITIFKEKIQLPHLPYPFFTMAMSGLVVSASGYGRERKEEIKKKIELMGGVYKVQLIKGATHLLVHSVQSEKYEKALDCGVTVMTEDWLDAVYSASLKESIKATDPRFDRFKCPYFKGLLVSVSKLSSSNKKRVQELIEKNGGRFTGSLTQAVNLLVISQPSGEKFRYAHTWNIPCVEPKWVYDSVKAGRSLPVKNYELETRMASTPERDEHFQQFEDMSVMSNIAPGDRTHVDETMMSSMMTDASVMSTVSRMPNQLRSVPGPSRSGNFLKPQPRFARASPKGAESPKRAAVVDLGKSSNVTPKKKISPSQFKRLLDELDLQRTKEAGPFLDGCKVFLYGFNAEHEDKLRRVLKGSGASRFLELSDSITHVLLGADCDPAFSKQLKELSYRPHVVTLQWLLQSVSLGRPANEEQYSCAEAEAKNMAPETPSPLSKKGLALLQRGDESPVAGREKDARPADTSKLASKKSSRLLKEFREPDKNEPNDLTAFYRSESSAEKPPQIPPEHPSFAITSASVQASTDESQNESAVYTQSDNPLFSGLTFTLVSIPEESNEELTKLVEQYGGKILPRSSKGVPDYAIVPLTGAAVNAAGEIVTALWVEECIFHNKITPLEYFLQPISLHKGKYPLRGCVIGLSGYARKERIFLMEVTNMLGGLAQEVFARKDNEEKNAKASTHLVCNAAEGSKFAAAKKWKLPAVTHLWILECCKTGTRAPVQPFLIHPDQEIVETSPAVWDGSLREESKSEVTSKPDGDAAADSGAEDMAKENVPIGGEPKTPIRPLAFQRVAGQAARDSPLSMKTPDTPYGISENPSPGERKRLKKWIESIPDYPQSPAYSNRRLSTPMSELRRQVWAKYAIPTPKTAEDEKPGSKRPGDQTEESSPQSAKRARIEDGEISSDVETPSAAGKSKTQRNLFAENVSRAEGQIEEVNKLLQMPIAAPTGCSNSSGGPSRSSTSPPKERIPAPKAQKEVSQPYCINWEDPATVAEAKNAPEVGRPSASSTLSKRKSSEDEDTPTKRSSLSNSTNVDHPEKDTAKFSKTRVFMLSSIDDRERHAKMLDALGGEVIQGTPFQQRMTHLVIDKPVRGEKLLASIASGKWVLHASYIEDSYKEGRFLEEENYEWGAPSNEKLNALVKPGSTEHQLAAAAHRWRKKLSGKDGGAFSGVRAVLRAAPARVDSFKRLIEAGSGVVLLDTAAETATHYLIDQKTSHEGLKVPNDVPVLPLMYLNDFLVKYPPPSIEDCAIKCKPHFK